MLQHTRPRNYRPAALRTALGLLLALGAAATTLANTVTDLYNTGVSNAVPASAAVKIVPTGAATNSTTELHYTKVGGSGPIYIAGSPVGVWILGAGTPNSNWISEDGYTGATPGNGFYTRRYRTTFTLPASVNLASVVIKGDYTVDNYVDFFVVNGHLIPNTTIVGYNTFQPFALPSGQNNFFCAGVNTIDFIWRNVGGPGGLNVRWTQATYSVLTGMISDLFNTGVNSSAVKVSPGASGAPELHYSDITTAAPVYVVGPLTPGWYGWSVPSLTPNSNWISPSGSGDYFGFFVKKYRTTFTLPSNAIPSTVLIDGNAVVDNRLNNVYINAPAAAQGFSIPTATSASFTAWHTFGFYASPTAVYHTGVNTIDYEWQNDSGAAGLNVEYKQRSYQYRSRVPCVTVPYVSPLRVSLQWMGEDGDTFTVQRSLKSGGPYTPIAALQGSSFADSSVVNGTKYFYVVSASNAAGEVVTSPEVSATPLSVAGYWRFEEGKPGTPVAAGASLPDSSGSRNTLQITGGATAPVYNADPDVIPINPLQGNARSMVIHRDLAARSICSLTTSGAAGGINTRVFKQFTIEASFMQTGADGAQTLVGKDGYGINRKNPNPASLYLQVTAPDPATGLSILSLQAFQADGKIITCAGMTPISLGAWHCCAVVCDGFVLSLYLQDTPGGAYHLENTVPFVGGLYPQSSAWTVGAGQYANAPSDGFEGEIDEVRVCDSALSPSQFLFAAPPVVTGSISLEGIADFSAINPAVPVPVITVSFRAPGATDVLTTSEVTLAATTAGSPVGTFRAPALQPGTYDVLIKGDKNLSVLLSGVTVPDIGCSLPGITLPGGDANNDNSVDSSDFTALIGSFNSDVNVPGSGYDARADFNYDGSVDSSDFTLLIGEFNQVGAN